MGSGLAVSRRPGMTNAHRRIFLKKAARWGILPARFERARRYRLWSAGMRLASYIAHGRPSFGAVVGDGVVDFRVRFGSRFATLADLFRVNAFDEARALLAGVRPDFALAAVELVPPLAAPEKILCIGINYANRN